MNKRLLLKVFVLVISIQVVSCLFRDEVPPKYVSSFVGKERDSFWVIKNMNNNRYKTDPAAWENISVVKKYDNDKVVIYIDKRYESAKSDNEILELAEDFNEIIYPKVTNNFATPFDIDENGKTIIVLANLRDGYSGYFFNVDFVSSAYVNKFNKQNGYCLHSNEGDIVYIDLGLEDKDEFHGTTAHEFMHLVSASHGILNGQNPLDTWIEEGLAEAANHIYINSSEENTNGKVIKKRVKYFNGQNENVGPSHSLFNWDSNYRKLLNYSLSYLFFQFLYHHASDKEKIFKNIISSGNVNHYAIIDAMNADVNFESWGSTGEEKFQKLLLRFYATNAGVEGDNYRYADEFYENKNNNNDKKEFAIKVSTYSYTDLKLELKTGAGVAVQMINILTSFNEKCIYLSVKNDGNNEDFNGYEQNDKLIAVNYIYDTAFDSKETITLPEGKTVTETENQNQKRSSFYLEEDEEYSVDLVNSPEFVKEINNFEISE